tara:strand:+ start:486 stop:1271 length:786 start_codon:yes stop_codon:yes gene_type:complete
MIKESIWENHTHLAMGDIRPMLNQDKEGVADDTAKYFVHGGDGNLFAVLICSNPNSPNLISRSIERATIAQSILANAGSVIIDPIACGEVNGLSYAIWPLKETFSTTRIKRYFQKRKIVPEVFFWLRDVVSLTKVQVDDCSNYVQTFNSIARDDELPDEVRVIARKAESRMGNNRFTPYSVLEHGDLWVDNILLPLGRSFLPNAKYGFFVIDWAGSRTNGNPFYDLFRFAISAGKQRDVLRSEIEIHCTLLGCDVSDVACY